MRQDHLARVRAHIAALCLGSAAFACGGSDSAKVVVTLEFPSESAANRTATVHLWVVMPNGRDPEVVPTCNMLVAEEITPYDLNLAVKYDGVVSFPIDEETGLVATDVDSGNGFVYVEAVDFGGGAHLAGCMEVSLDGGTTEATLVLRAPGTYDCSDAAVDNGEFCDDGDFCTVGEECRDGSCVNGIDRDCSALSDVCNTASCDSDIGCVIEPLPDLTSCATDDYCVTGSVCMEGVCEGNERDCSDDVPQCYAGVCDEDANSCDQVPISEASCDDEDECTGDDTCTVGFCEGTPLTSGACDDEDPCTVNTTCGGDGPAGVCGGGGNLDADGDGHSPEANPACGGLDCNDDPLAGGANEDPDTATETGLCADGYDNDCDGLEDAADPDCT